MIEILKELCKLPTAFGMENGILDYIEKNYAKDVEYSVDGMGNLTALKKCGRENAGKIMLYASTDACGFIVNYICDNGYLRVTRLGSASAVSSAFTELVSEKGIHGFIVPEKGAEVKDADASKLYIDIGAKSKEEAEKCVKLGDVFAVIPSFVKLCGTRCGGNGVAGRVSAAILLKLMRDVNFENTDVYFSFGVQNTLRNRGAKTAAFDISPDICICLDVCESFDTEGAGKRGEAVLGDGAVVIAKTSDYCMPPALRTKITDTAEKNGVSYKVCIYNDKATNASAVSTCKSGVECAEICVPSRNIGSGAEIFDISDAENVLNLVSAFIAE